ncbi:hypothetical protein FO519_004928 [Halicephalobus sp. NKZ332]|nr:hypothetical protein FO519_004928 [Halicephalobus sp. NKZ332]
MEHLVEAINKIQIFHDLFLNALTLHGDNVAFIDAENEANTVTYSEVKSTALKVANFLLEEAGLKKQETVGLLMANCWEYVSIHVGTSLVGGIFTAISSHFTNFEISHQLRDSDTAVVFVDGIYLDKVLAVLPECPKIRKIVVLGEYSKNIKATVDILPWHFIGKFPSKVPKTPEIDVKDDICWLPYSSGTTGLPKGVMLTHKNYMDHFKAMLVRNVQSSKNIQLPPSEYMVCFLPIYHAMGYAGVIGSVIRGQTIVLMKKYSLEKLLHLVEKYKPSVMLAAPTIVQQITKNPLTKKYDLSSIRIIGSGGSKLDEGTMKKILKEFPNIEMVGQGYGMTEAVTMLSNTTGKKGDPLDCVGSPLPGVDIKIVDPDTNEFLPQGGIGEIRFKAPYTMKGYWKNPEATKACYDENGYFKTGDVGYLSNEGLLFIKDRIKELIKVKAFQVPPAELEAVLITHPLVADSAVIGIPDEVSGEVPKAFVVRSSKKLTEDEVVNFIAEKLSYYKHLKGGVEFVQEIPRTASGKIMRRYFRDREATRRKSKL